MCHLKEDQKLCWVSKQDMSELIMHPCVLLHTSALRNTHTPTHAQGVRSVYTAETSAEWRRRFAQFIYSHSRFTRFPLQAKYWNSSVNEVEGTITDNKGKVVRRLFGKWHEAVFCGDPPSATCIWRASMSHAFVL